ncbi:P-loop containing nucleoside triphosphate hydrolase protein [Dichotomocladium elegans]|nr:P-loop containing nucleoside triphosphate hydrolase protein [Dichotomocladium elegans]
MSILTLDFVAGLAFAGTCLASSIVLSVQRRSVNASSPDSRSPNIDLARDMSVPYSDRVRPIRLVTETSLVIMVSTYSLYLTVSTGIEAVPDVAAVVLALGGWLYALVLAFLSTVHTLPNDWGWVINVHLAIIYAVGWCQTLWELYNSPWVLPHSALVASRFVLVSDLVVATCFVSRGPPFLDIQGRPVAGLDVASIKDILFFSWLSPLVHLAHKKQGLSEDDLPSVPASYKSRYLYNLFGQSRNTKRGILYRICATYWTAIVLLLIITIISGPMFFVPTFLINRFLAFIQGMSDETESTSANIAFGFMLILLQGASVIIRGILEGQYWFIVGQVIKIRVLAALRTEIYRKAFRQLDQVGTSTGQIMNMITTDVASISFIGFWPFNLLFAPIQLAIGIYFLYYLLGRSCLLGLGIMVIILPVNHFSAKILASTQLKLGEARDKRVALMNEVLQGIRQIKFFASEKSWAKRIMDSRMIELGYLRVSYLADAFLKLVWQGSPHLIALISFWSYTKLEGKELDPTTAFTSLMLFEELKFSMSTIPESIVEVTKIIASAKRIDAFLAQDELHDPPLLMDVDPRIRFKNATVGWGSTGSNTHEEEDGGTEPFTIKDINLEFPSEKLSLICGKTGCGKTLLLLSLLGETAVLKGEVSCPRAPLVNVPDSEGKAEPSIIHPDHWIVAHHTAFVAQTAWLQNASIRDNILFGLPYVQDRYEATLSACALDKDLTMFESYDLTEIGEKGITLSGGQKARVALARAVYSRAKIILMDDILSAVDAHTAKHLYQECLVGPLMANRTRILVTHHVMLCLGGCDYVVQVQNGMIARRGTPTELRASGEMENILDGVETHESDSNSRMMNAKSEGMRMDLGKRNAPSQNMPKKLVEEEGRATGAVKARLYKTYFGELGGWVFWLILSAFIFGTRALDIIENWWVKKWTGGDNDPDENGGVDYYVVVYAIITLTNVIFTTSRFVVIYIGSLRASKRLYSRLLDRILHAPLRFFDTTPVGRMINRFSKDMNDIDSQVPVAFINTTRGLVNVVSIFVIIALAIPPFTLPILVFVCLMASFAIMFNTTARELNRMASVSNSPIFSHFSESIVGATTIRAFGVSSRFLAEVMEKIDINSRPLFYVYTSQHWMAQRFHIFSAFINISMGAYMLWRIDQIDASIAGFCFTFAAAFSDQLFETMMYYIKLEMSFNSIERVVEFMEIPQDPPETTDTRPPNEWPSQGKVEVRELEVRYAADLDPVLKRISFDIYPKEKVGVVGRTGSGKSTLALSFFRFVEATHGSITIDGVDIHQIGTHDLRHNLTIIPQDPTLFSGTLRDNIDPFHHFTDDAIFESLRRVHLLEQIDGDDEQREDENGDESTGVFRDLTSAVSEGGKNFSQGQRQLICLARALLRRSKLVLMDEATASVDFKTDRAIQKTISEEFVDSTILCIAHRLHTVINYDRILVMENGQVLEQANPLELILDQKSVFHKMCMASGEYHNLLTLAKAKHQLLDID